MKKLVTVSSVIAVLAGSSAFAKTEGNYFGVDFIRSNVEHKYKNADGSALASVPKFHNKSNGFGLNYKHAFSLGNGMFIAPGIFYDKLGTRADDNVGDPISLSNRYGAKLDFGYDVTDKLAVYFTNGFAKTNYLVDWSRTNSGQTKKRTPLHYFYGAGASFELSKSIVANVEYNTQHISSMTPAEGMTARTKISVMKVGLAYKF